MQSDLRAARLDGWLFYDFRGRDPIAQNILKLPPGMRTRRWFYFVPIKGTPKKLVHKIETNSLAALPGDTLYYAGLDELEKSLRKILARAKTIAMQYSPKNAIPYVSMVDAGTVELIRSFGKDVRSSADLVSIFEAVLTEDQIATHYVAQEKIDRILAAGFRHIGDSVRAGTSIGEHDVVQYLLRSIAQEGLFTDHGPNCSVGPNSADSHYEPTPASSRLIRPGEFVLIDIWAKLANRPDAIWYDITWTGVVDRSPTDREGHIFATVRDARDAAIETIESAYAANQPIAGWQADDASRNVIRAAGFADFFTHRTGHNIATELHGNGAHLDNLETHDERLILPNTCFSVEPGLYFPGEFGVRNEVNMITRGARGPEQAKATVSGPRQNELLRI